MDIIIPVIVVFGLILLVKICFFTSAKTVEKELKNKPNKPRKVPIVNTFAEEMPTARVGKRGRRIAGAAVAGGFAGFAYSAAHDHDDDMFASNSLFNDDDSFNNSSFNDDDSSDYLTDPMYSFMTCNIFHTDDDFGSSSTTFSSDDSFCTDSSFDCSSDSFESCFGSSDSFSNSFSDD